jgi:hypothetical protein
MTSQDLEGAEHRACLGARRERSDGGTHGPCRRLPDARKDSDSDGQAMAARLHQLSVTHRAQAAGRPHWNGAPGRATPPGQGSAHRPLQPGRAVPHIRATLT